ncbi:hypothetical protein A2U01_0074511, partial [Trifolium medium]|nr:hypothetical protein [Trifolium medium]
RKETCLTGDMGGGWCGGQTPLIAPPPVEATSWNKDLDKESFGWQL